MTPPINVFYDFFQCHVTFLKEYIFLPVSFFSSKNVFFPDRRFNFMSFSVYCVIAYPFVALFGHVTLSTECAGLPFRN